MAAPQQQYTGGITYNPISFNFPMPTASISLKNVDYKKWSEDQKERDKWNYGLQTGAMAANTAMSITSMALNFAIQKEYYKSLRTGMKAQLRLGLASVDLAMDRNKKMKEMNEDNNKTAIKINKIHANAQVKIASVNQKGLTDRAKVFAAYNAFSRRQPFYGMTA